jgi:hypothetical protein
MVSAERERRSRLKGGCSQDWLPHKSYGSKWTGQEACKKTNAQ